MQSGVRSSCHQSCSSWFSSVDIVHDVAQVALEHTAAGWSSSKVAGQWREGTIGRGKSGIVTLEAQFATRRRRREHKDELSRLADRALRSVQLGELSDRHWKALVWRWAQRRRFRFWVIQRRALPFRERLFEAVREVRPERFDLDEKLFLQCVRSSRRGGQAALQA